jgi:hypothetical protein
MQLDISSNIQTKDIEALEEQVAEQISRDFKVWLSDKSKEGFYLRLAATVGHWQNNVVADGKDAGLCKYIVDQRQLMLEYLSQIEK